MTALLLAEDDHDLRDLTSMVLARHGCDVTAVPDGRLARALVTGGEHFDVLVLDLDLPGCTGLEVAHAARVAGHVGGIVLWTGWELSVPSPEAAALGVRVLTKRDVTVLRSAVLESRPALDLDARAG